MKLEDIKNMSDDEFIELIKKYLSYDIIKRMYEGKLNKKEKKTYKSVIITLGLATGAIPIMVIEEVLDTKISLGLTIVILTLSSIGSYIICSKERKKDYIQNQEKFNQRLIKLKNNIINLTEEEFDILVKCYEYIKNNEVPDEVFEDDNVLEITDELLSINATNILKEFEVDSSNKFTDANLDNGHAKTMNKND